MGKNSFVLKGTVLYSASLTEIKGLRDGHVVCVDGRCEGVYQELPSQYEALELVDYGNCMIIPGLVDLHVHAPQFSFRGTGMDLELMQWLDRNAFPEEASYKDLEYADKAYGQFVDCIHRSATTRSVVFATRHREATELLMDKLEESGQVSYVGKVNMDRLAPESLVEESARVSADETRKWLEDIRGRYENTMPIITPRFIPLCSNELLTLLSQLRGEYGLPLQSHLSENLGEIEMVRELVPESRFYGDAYDRFGLFGGSYRCVMAHCVHPCDDEIALMKANGVYVAHCPECNANISSGIAPVRKYLDAGLNVGLGTDIAGGATESIFSALTDAIRVSKLYWRLVDQSCRPLTFPEAFYLATAGGGSFFGKVGTFAKGYEFDAVILSDDRQPCVHDLDPVSRLERFAYIRGDMLGVKAKYIRGRQVL